MTMLPVITAPSMGRYTHTDFPDVAPFTIREGATWESVLSSIRVWIRDDLVPFLEETNPGSLWEDNAAALTDAVNAALKGATDQFTSMFNSQFTGSISAPAPTGDAATDTANLIAAFAAAKSSQYDLRLTVSPLGAVKYYKANQPLTWSLSRGSLIGVGHVGIDFSAMSSSYDGAALYVQGEQGNFNYGAHLSAQHRIEGIRFVGHNTDASQMDGVMIADTAGNIDQGRFVACFWYGFHDGITFGDNVWSIDFMKCAISSSHRYGINLEMGNVSGECISLTHTSIFGTHNANGTGIAVYGGWDGVHGSADFRMIGGSLDYNDQEGYFEAGGFIFDSVHIEDNQPTATGNSVGEMFVYNAKVRTSVMFRDCAWDSSAGVVRWCIHHILTTCSSKLMLAFDGDHGGVYPNTWSIWLQDDSKNLTAGDAGMMLTMRNSNIDGAFLYGQALSMLANGSFEDSSSFVAGNAPAGTGWYNSTYTGGTWSIGPGGNPGAGLTLQSTQVGNHYCSGKVRVRGNEVISMGTKIQVVAVTQGAASMTFEVYAEDGTTQLSNGRVGNSHNSTTAGAYVYERRTMRMPRGAAYLLVKLNGEGFVGTALFDQAEVVRLS